ncbi:hypothetical protein [Globicatella sanguinis]
MRPTQLCGGGQTKRNLFNFLLLAHSQKQPFLSRIFIFIKFRKIIRKT